MARDVVLRLARRRRRRRDLGELGLRCRRVGDGTHTGSCGSGLRLGRLRGLCPGPGLGLFGLLGLLGLFGPGLGLLQISRIVRIVVHLWLLAITFHVDQLL